MECRRACAVQGITRECTGLQGTHAICYMGLQGVMMVTRVTRGHKGPACARDGGFGAGRVRLVGAEVGVHEARRPCERTYTVTPRVDCVPEHVSA